jgi:hypothetical protein
MYFGRLVGLAELRRSKMRVLPAFVFVVAFGSAVANASAGDEQAFIDQFGGSWAGSATITKNSTPWQVGCQVVGRPTVNHIAIEGNCTLSIISVRIAADITFDPKSGRYSGTYIGAKVGPAHVSGKRTGSVVNLAITWPSPVNGDTKARMTIENTGGGSLRMVTFDNVVVGGPEQRTSDADLRIIGPGTLIAKR